LFPSVHRYAVAAVLLIAAFAGIFFYQDFTSPNLIGESSASTEIVRLPDGSEVTLRSYSKLFEVSSSETKASYILDGEAYFKVTTNPNRTFSVSTDQAEVQVLGTRFVLSDWGGTSTIYLEEGRIEYTSLDNQQSVELVTGQTSSIKKSTGVPEVTTVSENIYTDWLVNQLVFQNDSVAIIFAELEHHFNINIQAQPNILQENLSGSVQLDSLNSVLGNLELVLGGSFEQTGPNSYVFSANE
ncbi:MAG: FecR domain-containing protein, partial [Gracilimonas sp.]|nr:FecR domain-containing protein [Gracilimonas sp.]